VPTWTQKLAIGVPAIDKQHQQLFERADALLLAMKEHRSAGEVRGLVGFLEEYCAHHFRSEENLMRERRFAGRQEHEEQHALFNRRFRAIVDAFAVKGPSLGVTVDLQDLITSWLVKHVSSVDVELGRLAARKGLPADGPPPPGGRSEADAAHVARGAAPVGEGDPSPAAAAGRPFEPVFVSHGGKRILRLDFGGLSRRELLDAFDLAGSMIAEAGPASLRILTLLASAVTEESAGAFKRYALRNRPHVFASAIVATPFWKIIVTDLLVRGRDDLMLFDHELEALDWLASR